MKKCLSLFLALVLLTLTLTACGGGKPDVEELRPRIIELIEASYEINDIFFGDGIDRVDYEAEYDKIIAEYAEKRLQAEEKLKEYKSELNTSMSEQELAEIQGKIQKVQKDIENYSTYMFTKEEFIAQYDTDLTYTPVRSDKYLTVSDIKAAAEQVYSKSYLMSIYETMFVGYIESGMKDMIYARYYEGPDGLMILKDADVWVTAKRIYDYDTMKIVRPSSANKVTVLMDSHLEGQTEILPVRLSFVLQDGVWYLNSPSY